MQLREQRRSTRDSQRQRVYNAETMWRANHGTGEPLETVKDVERFTRRVLSAKRVLKRWPFMHERAVEVRDGRRRSSSCAEGDGMIRIIRNHRNAAVVLHELAHIIHYRGSKWYVTQEYGMRPPAPDEDPLWHQPHGYQFCRIFLDLVLLYMGKPAADGLKAAFKAQRVRYKAKRRMSPEQRAAAGERLKRVRLNARFWKAHKQADQRA